MPIDKSKIVPTAFWVGFLALGFVTSLGGPNKHHVAKANKSAVAAEAMLEQSDRPAVAKVGLGSAQD